MFYSLYSQFDINIFQYLTFRAGLGFFIAFFLTLFFMPKFIAWAKSKKASQPISEYAPTTHKLKKETPTMGGLVFIVATIVATLLSAKLTNIYVILGVVLLVLFTLIGIKDDFAKIALKTNAGLNSKTKFILQVFSAFLVSIFLVIYGFDSNLYSPFIKNPLFDMGILAILFWGVVIIATSNAVNLTDGLDGLATVPSIFSLFSLLVLVYITGNAVISGYLLMPKVNDVGEVIIIGASLCGALIGFLWYNSHPAQVFMGDSGSLSIGAFIAYMAIISKSEFLLILIGSIFVIETLSVILQIGSYKTRGKRVFLMAPIHHHFEIKGWAENKIIVRFWIIALMSNIIALITIKIR